MGAFNEYEASEAQKASIIRYTALVLVIINAILEMVGFSIIPIAYSEIIASGLIAVVGLWAGFKNNYLTRRGKAQAAELSEGRLLHKPKKIK